MANTPVPDTTITRDEAQDALKRSGYLIEARVAVRLEQAGYYVQPNDAYVDPATSKSRELDLFAIGTNKVSRQSDWIFPVLFVECVKNPQPLVLLSRDPVVGFLFHEDFKLAGLPGKILLRGSRKNWESVPEFLQMQKYLHYCSSRIATQFFSFSLTKEKKWIALHDAPQFDAFQKLCDAADYHVKAHYLRSAPTRDDSINLEFYYPLLLIQGDLLEAQVSRRGLTLKAAGHLCFRRTVIREGQEINYFIDVVTEKTLPRILSQIASEMEKATKQIKRKKADFQRSIDAIYQDVKGLRSKERIASRLHL